MKYSRAFVLSAVALVCLFTSGVAFADTCNANSFQFTFDSILQGGIRGTFDENGLFDCVDIQITDRFSSTEFTLEAWEGGGTVLSDRMVFSNAGGFLNICILSYLDSGNQTDTCDRVGNITKQIYDGDPNVEILDSGRIFDVVTGYAWSARFTSQDIGNRSDYFVVSTIPEPGSLILLATGALGLAGAIRRKSSV